MNAQHTPGPWIINCCTKRGSNLYRHHITVEEGQDADILATVPCDASRHPYPPDDAVAEANARLIAAAPELLGTLQRIVTQVCDQGQEPSTLVMELARAAIAKAVQS